MLGSFYAIAMWKWVLGTWQPQAQLTVPTNPFTKPTADELCNIASAQAQLGFAYATVIELQLLLGAQPQVVGPACMAGPLGFKQVL